MVGSALVRCFSKEGYTNLLLRTHQELDLLNQQAVFDFLKSEKPDFVIIAAAKVGGIMANDTFRAQFIYENLAIESNLIHGAHLSDIDNLLFLGSSCIYPKNCPQPMKEEYLLTGELEPTNEPYAISKIAGIKMCESYYHQFGRNYFSVMPTNLYGPNDNYNLETSHVLPALIRKFHEAKINDRDSVTVWGTGKPCREFLYVDDLAEACIFVMKNIDANNLYPNEITHLNIGTGDDISIADLTLMIKEISGFKGNIKFDSEKPDGVSKKLLCTKRIIDLGWEYSTNLGIGLRLTYDWYRQKSFLN